MIIIIQRVNRNSCKCRRPSVPSGLVVGTAIGRRNADFLVQSRGAMTTA